MKLRETKQRQVQQNRNGTEKKNAHQLLMKFVLLIKTTWSMVALFFQNMSVVKNSKRQSFI